MPGTATPLTQRGGGGGSVAFVSRSNTYAQFGCSRPKMAKRSVPHPSFVASAGSGLVAAHAATATATAARLAAASARPALTGE